MVVWRGYDGLSWKGCEGLPCREYGEADRQREMRLLAMSSVLNVWSMHTLVESPDIPRVFRYSPFPRLPRVLYKCYTF